MADDVTVGVDVGTTSVKVVAYRDDGTVAAEASRDYPLYTPHAGWAEQDPDEIVEATLDAVAAVRGDLGATGVAAIGLGTVMHSLIGLGDDDRPLTRMVTYADGRAWPQALRLRREHGDELYRTTGTPIHPMAPLAKLRWFAEERPDLSARVAAWVSIKELLLRRLCGSRVVDISVASTTGLFDLTARGWHAGALAAAGVDAERLGDPVPTTTVLEGVRADTAERLDLPRDTPVVVGATDGVLANLGVGATTPGVAALTIGTSGAIRVPATGPRTDPRMRTFCYALTGDRWVLGGAISNGGLVLRWLGDEVLDDDLDGLTSTAAEVAPGSAGLLMLPYLTGERAPGWSPLRGGVLFGLRFGHGRGHVVRAALEGVALQLRLVADALRDADATIERLRVTGGFVASDLWVQIVADVLGTQLEVARVEEAAAHGAALLARHGIGRLDDLEAAGGAVEIARTVAPDAAAAAAYDDVARRYAELVEHLAPLLRDADGVDAEGAEDT